MPPFQPKLPWLAPDDPFPSIFESWDENSPAPGLLAAGGSLDVATLLNAYSRGIFPWFSEGQPILWWSTAPRMTLHTGEFRLHKSLKKVIRRFRETPDSEIKVDSNFSAVLDACSNTYRHGQSGTWILPEMKTAYLELHQKGYAHSVETWKDGNLIGGLYCVSVGRAVFGESMFASRADASKIALAALVGMTSVQGVKWIDCQQVTDHLAFMGARPIDRVSFSDYLEEARSQPAIEWRFEPLYWDLLLSACANST